MGKFVSRDIIRNSETQRTVRILTPHDVTMGGFLPPPFFPFIARSNAYNQPLNIPSLSNRPTASPVSTSSSASNLLFRHLHFAKKTMANIVEGVSYLRGLWSIKDRRVFRHTRTSSSDSDSLTNPSGPPGPDLKSKPAVRKQIQVEDKQFIDISPETF